MLLGGRLPRMSYMVGANAKFCTVRETLRDAIPQHVVTTTIAEIAYFLSILLTCDWRPDQ
jgi:hypothetical protein